MELLKRFALNEDQWFRSSVPSTGRGPVGSPPRFSAPSPRPGWALCLMLGLSLIGGRTGIAADPTPQGAATRHTTAYPFTNRLIDSADPYLLMHAHNPVDWYPWGPEALEKAKRENKPIFVSIGYSTCFWCHVAERTIYSDPAIAKLMNAWFVNIKIDREQRPDLDQIYMLARELMTGQGGWPNNVFLTPDLRPFFAGSYFPPADDPVRGTGFLTILRGLHDAWMNQRPKVVEVAANAADAMRRAHAQSNRDASAPVDPAEWLKLGTASLLTQFDAVNAGIGSVGPKFPRAPSLEMLLADSRINRNESSRGVALKILDAILFGGIHDHLGGGFHRYSIDSTWSIPHFEKMLYDNVQLLQLYAEAFEVTANPVYRQATQETADYLMREMTSRDAPGFFTAQDSEVDGLEGTSYRWTRREIIAVLGEDTANHFFKVYLLTPMPDQTAPGIANVTAQAGDAPGVLRIRLPVERTVQEGGFNDVAAMMESLSAERATLRAVRDRRRQPMRDEKILTGLNGLAISAFATAGRALKEPKFIAIAQNVGRRIWSLAYDPKTQVLKHEIFKGVAHTNGFLQDYAQLGEAFLSLDTTTSDPIWRDRASRLARDILDQFARDDGSFTMSGANPDTLISASEEGDTDAPSGTSSAIDLLLKLGAVPRASSRYLSAASRAVTWMSSSLSQYPAGWATAVVALMVNPFASRSTAASARNRAVDAAPKEFHVPVTSDHVRVSAQTDSSAHQIVVTATIDVGYHINANAASFDYLIPTSVTFGHVKPLQVRYPKAARFKTEFASSGLDVYEGSVQLLASIPPHAPAATGAVHGVLTAQACDARGCLPPSKIPFTVDASER